jgi:hypothetical protein
LDKSFKPNDIKSLVLDWCEVTDFTQEAREEFVKDIVWKPANEIFPKGCKVFYED